MEQKRIYTVSGQDVLTYEEIENLRKEKSPHKIIAQRGGQENMLSCNADILIGGGSRGGSKSFSLLMETLYDIGNPNFRALLMRSALDDLTDLIDVSYQLYSNFGEYNKSRTDMTWNYNCGGFLKFSYHDGSFEDFKARFQGRQFAYIGVDEITQMSYPKFKYIITCNRNAFGIRNRFIGTCNPDPDSWVAKFIDWWIAEDGKPDPSRNGVIRYCFMDGDDVSTIIWGNTRDEVYEQAKPIIDRHWSKDYSRFGSPKELFIKSVAFVEAKLADNLALMESDPTYLANLANQSEEQRARDLDGNWKFKSTGDDLIKITHMERFFNNSQQLGDKVRRASCDIAYEGGDNLVLWLWEGWHIKDIFVCQFDAIKSAEAVKARLEEWQVLEENFTYDYNGMGQHFKAYFPRAIPFNNAEGVDPKVKYLYNSLKSQAAYLFAQKILQGEISISPDLLERRFSGSGFKNTLLRDILLRERKAIRRDNEASFRGWAIIKKSMMKRIVGHSPDFIESLFMRMIFEIKHKQKHIKGLGLI